MPKTKINVNFAATSPMPTVLKPSVFTFRQPNAILPEFLSEFNTGAVMIDITQRVIKDSWSPQNAVTRARELVPDLAAIISRGATPILAIAGLPTLWSPTDWSAWAAHVANIAVAIKTNLGSNPLYQIGWEPDAGWEGTEAEFGVFYANTSAGLKTVGAPVGGPATSTAWTAFLPNFVQFCNTNNLPLDFIVWHQFNTDSNLSFELAVNQIRQWAGNRPLILGEWSTWMNFPDPSPEHDTSVRAAHMVTTLVTLAKLGVTYQTATSLIEQQDGPTPFVGSFGIYSNQYIRKPVFHALKFLSSLASTRLAVTSDNQFVSAIAGKTGPSSAKVLIAAFTPSQKMVDTDKAILSVMGLPNTQAVAIETAANAARGKPRDISLTFSGLSLNGKTARIYRVDSTHCNISIDQTEYVNRMTSLASTLSTNLVAHLLLSYSVEEVTTFLNVQSSPDPKAALQALPEPSRLTTVAIADKAYLFVEEAKATVGAYYNSLFSPIAEILPIVNSTIKFQTEDGGVYLVDVS